MVAGSQHPRVRETDPEDRILINQIAQPVCPRLLVYFLAGILAFNHSRDQFSQLFRLIVRQLSTSQ